MSLVLTEIRDRVAVITLNDPQRRNMLTLDMNAELIATVEACEANEDVGALVVTGATPAFCSGANLDDLLENRDPESLGRIYAGFLRVAHSTIPTIAAVNGAAVGAGMNMALACDVIIAAERARFDVRFLDLAIHPGGGHTWRLQNVTNMQTTKAMVLFGQMLRGQEAAERGLAWTCVADNELLAVSQQMAARAASFPKELVARTKASINAGPGITSSVDSVALEIDPQVWSMGQPEFDAFVASVRQRMGKSV